MVHMEKNKMKRALYVEIDESLYWGFKAYCREAGYSMARAVEAWLEKRLPERFKDPKMIARTKEKFRL